MKINKELVFDFSDMRLISIECNECRTEITMDALQNAKRHNQGVPTICPSCGIGFDPVSVQTPIANYLDVYTAIGKIRHKVSLKVRALETEKAEIR